MCAVTVSEDDFISHLSKPTDPSLFSPQLLPGEEHVRFLLEHPAAEIGPLCVRPAATDLEYPL